MAPAGSVIRRATIEDVPAMLAISNWAAEHTPANFAVAPEPLAEWERDFREEHDRFPWLVAAGTAGAVTGFAKAGPWKGRCAYAYTAETTVYVHPEHHGRGLGRALYERLIEVLAAQGYHSLLAGITLPNDASVRLHEGVGFHRVATLERVGWKFERWHDVGYWQLELNRGAPGPVATVGAAWSDDAAGSR